MRKNNMEYKIIRADVIYKLQNEVTESIRGGWEPLGGMAADSYWIYQAMIRINNKK